MNKAAEKATISCGFTIFQNDDLFRYEDALTMADAALYKAKAAGKNQYKQY
jgi:PleD family two-component response regulator